MAERQPSENEDEPIARVYDRADGEHIANLHTPKLVHEFKESPLYDVEVLQKQEVAA